MFKAFVSDLDGTLLRSDHTLGAHTIETLRRLHNQGIRVVLASGRASVSIKKYVRQLGFDDPIIAFNGAQLFDSSTGKKLISNEIPVPLAIRFLNWAKENDLYTQIYDDENWYYEKTCSFSDNYSISSGIVGTKVDSLINALAVPSPKILGVGTNEQIAELLPKAQAAFDGILNITLSCPYFMEVTLPSVNKGNAVAALGKIIGATADEIICAGDALNDLSMMVWSHHALTVKEGHDEIKAVSRYIAGSFEEDGVAKKLDELIP